MKPGLLRVISLFRWFRPTANPAYSIQKCDGVKFGAMAWRGYCIEDFAVQWGPDNQLRAQRTLHQLGQCGFAAAGYSPVAMRTILAGSPFRFADLFCVCALFVSHEIT